MNSPVSLPLWLFLLICFMALWAAGHLFIRPLIRRMLKRREKRAIAEINSRLDLQLPPFKLFKRRVLIDKLLYDEKLRDEVQAHCRESGISIEEALAKIKRYAREIVPSFNAPLYFKFGNGLSKLISRLLYRIRVGLTDEKGLSKINPFSSVVFIMNHRSNMDYVLLGYLSFKRVALSFAVGEWARVWPLKQLISAMGAFFVRRGSKNPLYRMVLARYVQLATQGGVVQAIYPEGCLSRDGTLGEPRLGLLDYMVRAYNPEEDRDIVFIPVGINYDRVLEDRTLLLESDPSAPVKSRLSIIATTLRYIGRSLKMMLQGKWHRFGYAIVNFGTPISMKEYTKRQGVDFRTLNREERFEKVLNLAQFLMKAVGRVIPVPPVSLISRVFLEEPEKQMSDFEISARVQELISRLERTKAHIYIPRSDWNYAIDVGLRMLTLRHIIEEDNNLYKTVPEEIKILRYYANSIGHLLEQE
jgi:glycerol-3-phosphate O-acyltransferase